MNETFKKIIKFIESKHIISGASNITVFTRKASKEPKMIIIFGDANHSAFGCKVCNPKECHDILCIPDEIQQIAQEPIHFYLETFYNYVFAYFALFLLAR